MPRLLLALVLVLLPIASTAAPPPQAGEWTRPQVARLIAWMTAAKDDGLGVVTAEIPALQAALKDADAAELDRLAFASAVRLLNAHRHGCCNAALRTAWHIQPDPVWPDALTSVRSALASQQLDDLFRETRPSHPFYEALAQAFPKEEDPVRRANLAANLDRWRWMPRQLGSRYLLVNAAAFEATLWENGELMGRWGVVVGKTRSPTPVFRATVTGVTFNPWWDIPPSIAAESIAALVTRNPSEAARKGYIRENGRYRQRPGPQNALGRMKLVMPNAYNVYLHDTPAQSLFAQDVRAYSHGCVRVGDALGLASALLGAGWDRTGVDAVVAAEKTRTIGLPSPIPVYIAYFTAEPDPLGSMRYFPDIYRRDRGALVPDAEGRCTL